MRVHRDLRLRILIVYCPFAWMRKIRSLWRRQAVVKEFLEMRLVGESASVEGKSMSIFSFSFNVWDENVSMIYRLLNTRTISVVLKFDDTEAM